MSRSCPIDWMLCTSSECPRGALLAKQSQAMHAAVRAFAGDPFNSVGGIASSPNPDLIRQLVEWGKAEPEPPA